MRAILVATLAVALAACAAPGGSRSPEASATDASDVPARSIDASRPPFQTVPVEESMPPITGEVPEELMAAILADAERRTGVPVDEIETLRAGAVTWNDGSLGCPEPGMLYTQALVDGYQVVVDAAGEELDYRVGGGGGFRLCENPGPPAHGGWGDS